MTKSVMNVREVADFFGVSVSTVWRWTADGSIPEPIKLGGSTRWRRSDIEAVLSANAA